MIKCKRWLGVTLTIALCCMLCMPVIASEVPVSTPTFTSYELHPSASDVIGTTRATLDASAFEANHTKQVSNVNALLPFMINAQPSDAILFNSANTMAVVCDTPTGVDDSNPRGTNQISVNYRTGVLDLPRLDARYYYSIEEVIDDAGSYPVNNETDSISQYGFSVNRTLYPSLSWTKTVPANAEVRLTINSADTNAVLKKVTVKFATEQAGVESGWQDCSTYVLQDCLDPAYQAIYRKNGTTWYPAELHRSCLVTSNFIVGHEDIWGPGGDRGNTDIFEFFVNTFDTSSGSDLNLSQDYLSQSINSITKYSHYQNGGNRVDVRGLVYPYIQGTTHPEYLAVFMPHGQGVMYNSNKGQVTTSSSNSITKQYNIDGTLTEYRGVYAILYGEEFDVFAVLPREFTGELSSIDDGSTSKTFANGTTFNLENELVGRFGFKAWADANAANGFDVAEYPTIKYIGDERKTVNVYNKAMAYGGIIPHAGRLTVEAPIQHYKVTTWYQRPDDTSGKPLKCEEISIPIGGQAPSLKSPEVYIPMYQFDRWYTDQACTVPADMNTIHQNAKPNDEVQLYGKYNYTGGTYTVQFYNDATGESSSQTFECRDLPTLPETPTRPGYLFRNWQIVYNTASTSGTPYDPATFPTPSSGKKLLFKTFWDVQGVITDVTTNQSDYFVGDEIDESKVVVTVQTDNNGSTRTLSTDEFTVSPTKVGSVGRNQIQVTYTATGATATFNVTGKAIQPVSITARYNGSALNVGSTVSRSNITCTVNYNNGTTETVTDFTIAPTTIANAGANTIRVIYGSLSTTVTVTGNRPQTSSGGTSGGGTTQRPTPGANRPGTGSTTGGTTSGTRKPTTGSSQNQRTGRLQSITATYAGAQPYVGDILNANDINVSASYEDGSTTTLSSTAFQFSPSYIRNSGENTITVSYGGLTTTFTINALLKSESTVVEDDANGPTSTAGIVGVDENGNPIYSDSADKPLQSSVIDTGTTLTQGERTTLGNPLTGAGMPASGKGTSVGYLNGSNILTSRLYGGATSMTNTLDILSEINNAGDTASSVDIELYNMAADNDITVPMLQALKDKDLTLNITMLNPEDKQTRVGLWSIMGNALGDEFEQFNPNITFEVTDKGAETLTYMTVTDGEYPNGAYLRVYPALSTYNSGELIRIYSCGFDKSNAHLESAFTWSDISNDLEFDITKSKRYALSNAVNAYAEGESLTTDISQPSELDVLEGESAEDTESVDDEDTIEFDFGDDTSTMGEPVVDAVPKKKFPIGVVIIGGLALLMGAGGVTCLILLRRRNGVPMNSEVEDDDTFLDEDEEIGVEGEYDDADDDESFSVDDENEDFADGESEEES